eukprot:TRINITY_DN3346_c0_g4_i3.p1 TRINITY_DN3346_c0_g4~~TRINITY_DN3346_c0_g4_i3.p1  ORF type:complete len:125 (+),score=11.13 TRINITY_DN3346_c0_g4_i3:1083-1457(+)
MIDFPFYLGQTSKLWHLTRSVHYNTITSMTLYYQFPKLFESNFNIMAPSSVHSYNHVDFGSPNFQSTPLKFPNYGVHSMQHNHSRNSTGIEPTNSGTLSGQCLSMQITSVRDLSIDSISELWTF